ncbi:hypothetical protein ABB37_00071 [Leptomonas pyrrhocoris]|uniref:C3H1-type domain-containing protein n=1 Tax=Leptomonas pyrrhocoris TaxID=157538 RepID=A0A0M9G9Z8_LEPPY|nr:hypothetical protein ABB37_00071 [Leptomonas pyrrhocoris]KPA85686.1 hypothetical protein ABB37_00071 [Leptomonas pyrrhocoris]|eukprot:XP_015664125.1 hypothetical protein ABB37_00071 [Leptomonas pyrrhocoris]
MSWWNDLSTHRSAPVSGMEGTHRHVSSFASSPEYHGCTASSIAGSFCLNNGIASDEAPWGTSTTQSDAPSLWQTSNSAGVSDPLGLTESSPIWGPQLPQHLSTSPPPRSAGAFVPAASFVEKGMLGGVVRPLSGVDSRSSFNDSGVVLSTAVNGISATNVNVAGQRGADVENGHGGFRSAEEPLSGAAAAAAADGGAELVDQDSGDDDVLLYDDVDLGTISSLIASLQGNGALVGREGEASDMLRLHQRETNRHRTTTAAAALPRTFPVVVVDPASPAAGGQPASLQPRPRSLFADLMSNTRERELNRSGSGNTPSSPFGTSADGGGSANDRSSASCGSPFSSVEAKATGDTANIAPLHLTPSMLEGLLANFQTALKGRSDDTSAASPTPQMADTELLHLDRYGSPDAQDEMRTVPSTIESGQQAAEEVPLTCHGSPLMRSHVSSIVAHKLNIDGNLRGTPAPDSYRGVTAPASVSSSCSNPSTPVRQRGASVPSRWASSHHQRHPSRLSHERGASPDSSIDRFFSQASMPGTSYTPVQHFASTTAAEENAAEENATPHCHTRTESEISLPAVASTYNGGCALHHHVDQRGCINVVDPQRRKLHVPLSAIQTTKALNGRLKTPSLCLLFQSGRCRQGDNCYQVHVDPATVERLRVDMESMPCCCLLHGDCNCHLVDPASYEGRALCIAGQYNVPLSRVAYTAGLQRVLQGGATSVPVNPSVLCRLHGQPGGCRFGADCKFIHVCCSILNNELAHVMSSATAATNAPSTPAHQPQQPLRLGSSAPGSPSARTYPHALSNLVNFPLPNSSMLPATVAPHQAGAMPTGVPLSATGELSSSPPLHMQSALPLPGSGSPMPQELRQSNGSQVTGSPAAGPVGGALYNRNFISAPCQNGGSTTNGSSDNNNSGSLVSSANFSPMQFSQGMAPSVSGTYSSAGGLAKAAPTGPTNGAALPSQPSGSLFTVTTVQQSHNSPARSPAGRPAAPPTLLLQQQRTASIPGSPQPGYHLRTLSAQSTGPNPLPHSSSAMTQAPNRSGAGSPLNLGLPLARSMPNLCNGTGSYAALAGRSSGASSPMQQQQQQQRLYVQQINQDGTVTFVPVSMVQTLGC